jgi:hypothetical protein
MPEAPLLDRRSAVGGGLGEGGSKRQQQTSSTLDVKVSFGLRGHTPSVVSGSSNRTPAARLAKPATSISLSTWMARHLFGRLADACPTSRPYWDAVWTWVNRTRYARRCGRGSRRKRCHYEGRSSAPPTHFGVPRRDRRPHERISQPISHRTPNAEEATLRVIGGGRVGAAALLTGRHGAVGIVNTKALPCPGEEITRMVPPCSSTNFFTKGRPRPVPSCRGSVASTTCSNS